MVSGQESPLARKDSHWPRQRYRELTDSAKIATGLRQGYRQLTDSRRCRPDVLGYLFSCGSDTFFRSFRRNLVLSCLIHAVAGRTFPAGERGSAAGSLLSSHYPNYTWACVLCRPSPEFPFRFIWVLGWSTWHLALDPSSVLYLQHKLCSYLDALQHLPAQRHNNLSKGLSLLRSKRSFCELLSEALLYYDGLESTA